MSTTTSTSGQQTTLLITCGAKGNAEKPDARIGVGYAVGNQLHLGTGHFARHSKQFKPVVDGADGADKIVADPRPYQCRQIFIIYSHVISSELGQLK